MTAIPVTAGVPTVQAEKDRAFTYFAFWYFYYPSVGSAGT